LKSSGRFCPDGTLFKLMLLRLSGLIPG